MPVPVVVALLGAAVVTLVALVWIVRRLVVRLLRLGRDLEHLQRDLTPALADLQRDVEVTGTELAALGDHLEESARVRAARPRRRWRPPPAR